MMYARSRAIPNILLFDSFWIYWPESAQILLDNAEAILLKVLHAGTVVNHLPR